MTTPLLQLTREERAQFRYRAMAARHRLHELDFFDDDSLVSLLDAYPAERLHAFTMGTDPRKVEEWTAVDTYGVPEKDLLAAVKRRLVHRAGIIPQAPPQALSADLACRPGRLWI